MKMSEDKQLDLFDEEKRNKERTSIDRLFQDVKQYRNSAEFRKKLEFYTNFPYLGVYNAALVEQQRPGARFVLTAEKWKEDYNRKIKTNARPVIILLPFYPVEFLFDISDTKQIDKTRKEDENIIIERIINRHIASCQSEVGFYMKNLRENLPKYGIHYNSDYQVGSEMRAEIRPDCSEKMYVKINKDHHVEHHNHFTISVSSRADEVEQLAKILHELGHLFCHHIACSWWKDRFYTKAEKEFEAETVSYLVAKRLGIYTPSIEYLSYYVDEKGNIPSILINRVFDAVDLIEQLVKEPRDVTKCLLYKNDEAFKEKVDKEKELIKEELAKKKAAKASL